MTSSFVVIVEDRQSYKKTFRLFKDANEAKIYLATFGAFSATIIMGYAGGEADEFKNPFEAANSIQDNKVTYIVAGDQTENGYTVIIYQWKATDRFWYKLINTETKEIIKISPKVYKSYQNVFNSPLVENNLWPPEDRLVRHRA